MQTLIRLKIYSLFLGGTTQQCLCKYTDVNIVMHKFNAISGRLLAGFVAELDRLILKYT